MEEIKKNYFVNGAGDFMPEGNEIKEREDLLKRAYKGDRRAKLALMSPPYSLTYLIKDGKRII